jgi:hypothetical protein
VSHSDMSDDVFATSHYSNAIVIPQSEKAEPKPLYVCQGCSNHMYSNNMINRSNVG